MKKMFSLCLVIVIALCNNDVSAQSCCVKNAGDFQLLAMNDDFKAAHLDPLPFSYSPATGKMIEFKTLDGKTAKAFYVPSDQPTNNVLFIFHEWWGLNDYIKREAERWQQQLGNIDVYAVDLYDGQVATDAETASKLSKGLDKKRGENIVNGLIRKTGNDKRIATLGWCMGGSWSFTATALSGVKAAGCVMYYGFPEKDPKKIKGLNADVLYIWASQDQFITKDVVLQFGEQVKATGHNFEMHTFDEAHAFANPSNPKYDAEAAAKAEELSLAFLKQKLQLD